MMKITRWTVLAGLLLAGCGSSGGTSTTTSGGSATRGATSSALTAGSGSASSGATGAQTLVVQALQAQMKSTITTVPINESFTADFDCASGTGSGAGTIAGTVTVDSETNDFTLEISIVNTTTFTGCAPADIASTTDVDESDYTLDGTMQGDGTLGGDSDAITFDFPMNGTLEIGGACSGSLTFLMSVSGTSTADDITCTGSGSVLGTVCDEDVACTISGSCENPTVDC